MLQTLLPELVLVSVGLDSVAEHQGREQGGVRAMEQAESPTRASGSARRPRDIPVSHRGLGLEVGCMPGLRVVLQL